MKKYFNFILLAGMVFFFSCSKDNSDPLPEEPEDERIDLSIAFKHYPEIGKLYKDATSVEDTIRTEFIVTNHSKQTLKKGDSLLISSEFQGKEYNLRLQEGRSTLYLKRDLPPNDTFQHDPAPLYGNLTRAMLRTDSVFIGLRIYGVNNPAADSLFSSDPNPDNNRAEIVNTKDGTRRTK